MKDKMNVLILGSTGMLGSEVLKIFSEKDKYKIFTNIRVHGNKNLFKFNNVDQITFFKFDAYLDKVEKLKKYLKKNAVIINCIGIIKPYINEQSSKSIINAININSSLPHNLFNNFSSKHKIYQIATDCVFNGKKGLYTELDEHNAEDVYGKSKSLGEITGKNFFNIRTSIIGKELKNKKSLYEWFLLQKRNSTVNGFTNHYWNGLTTKAFAKILISIIDNKIDIPSKIHIMPKNSISKYKMLNLFNKNNKKKIKIKPIKAKKKINRTLGTIYPQILKKIWCKSEYQNIPSLEKLIIEM